MAKITRHKLNEIVAEKVMGERPGDLPLNYSFDLVSAFRVVSHLCDRPGAELCFQMEYQWEEGYGAWVAFSPKGYINNPPLHKGHDKEGRIGVAICIAALRAVGYTEELEVS